MIDILYEDNHLIAVSKPAGVLTQGDKTGDISLYDMVKDYIRIKKGKGSLLAGKAKPSSKTAVSTTGVFLGLLHRLDRPVSGIILFAKTSKGAARLSEQFRNRTVIKKYQAVVEQKITQNRSARNAPAITSKILAGAGGGVLINYLEKDTKAKKAIVVAADRGQLAELEYKVLKSNDKYSLLRIQIKTGRFHQIRAQLAAAGCPILGDLKYKASFSLPNKSIALSATNLSFETATTKERINLSVPPPKEWEQYIK